MKKIAKIAFFKVMPDRLIFVFEKSQYNMSNKKRTGKNQSQF
jgi:hypothetical protein